MSKRIAKVLFLTLLLSGGVLARTYIPIKFAAGSSQTVVEGTLKAWEKRTYVLSARSGQQLTAELNSDNTGTRFGDNKQSLGYQTKAGENYVYIWNNGRAVSHYKLTVSIR